MRLRSRAEVVQWLGRQRPDSSPHGENRRLSIIGPPSAGKSTLAAQLAERLSLVKVERDALVRAADGTEDEPARVNQRVDEAVGAGAWFVAGRALHASPDTVVWLDFPLPILLSRLVPKNLRQSLSRAVVSVDAWRRREELAARLAEAIDEQTFVRLRLRQMWRVGRITIRVRLRRVRCVMLTTSDRLSRALGALVAVG